MKELISHGMIEVLGDASKGWKEFDVRLAGAQALAEESAVEQTV
jgi:hypothetical protein